MLIKDRIPLLQLPTEPNVSNRTTQKMFAHITTEGPDDMIPVKQNYVNSIYQEKLSNDVLPSFKFLSVPGNRTHFTG